VGLSPVTERVTVEDAGGLLVVAPAGELDAFTAPELRSELHRLLEDASTRRLVVDLTAVTFLDSSALGVLVGALRRLRERGGELHLVQPRPTVRRIFEVTALDAVFTLHEARDEALAAARAQSPKDA
jgi:anti-sigma B factor antagonist